MKSRTCPAASLSLFGLSLVALLFCLFPASAFSQGVKEAKGFKTADHHPAPYESQIKTLVKSARIKPLPNGRFWLTNMTVQEFSITNTLQMVITAPECIYDSDRRHQTASSAGPLHVQTADGKFSIQGVGFLWKQANSSLTISNRVRTEVQPDVLAGSAAQGAAGPAGSPKGGIEILADHFEYAADSGLGIYRGNVQVNRTNLALTSGVLTLKLPMETRQLEAMTTEQDVTLDYSGIHATGQKANYVVNTGLLHVFGQPAWSSEQREGHADELLIDRTNKIFRALGNGYLKLGGPSLAGAGFLPTENSPSATPLAATNRVVEIFSDNYEIRTNWAVFRQDVRVKEQRAGQEPSRMTCALMTATFAGTNQLDTLTAENQVAIEQADKRFTAGKAVYTRTNGMMELTQNPAWQSGPRQGKGNVIRMNLPRSEMLVTGDATMRLPAGQLGAADLSSVKTARSKPTPTTTARSDELAEIACQDYTLHPEHVQFRGGVVATHPQMNWTCKTLSATLPPPGTQDTSLTAEQDVKFDVKDDKGRTAHGSGDKAVYTVSTTTRATNEVLHLTGAPAHLDSSDGTAHNNLIVWDRTQHLISTRGSNYVIRIKTDKTNSFEWPKGNQLKLGSKPRKTP